MKVVCIAVFAAAAGALKTRLPDDQSNSETADSFGNSKLEPPCSNIQCGEYECPQPFELKTDNTCCGYCYAPDHVVPYDSHVAIGVNSTGYVVDYCDSAPSTCKSPGANAVRCFKPACKEGQEAHCAPNACCAACAPR